MEHAQKEKKNIIEHLAAVLGLEPSHLRCSNLMVWNIILYHAALAVFWLVPVSGVSCFIKLPIAGSSKS